MRLIRTLSVVVAVLALVLTASSAQAAGKGKGKKTKKEHAVHGVVVKVEKDADKDSGTITVKIGAHKAKNGKPEQLGEEKTFKVTDATKFTEVSGKKGARETKPGKFSEVKDGEKVALEVKGDKAEEVTFHARKHKKAKKNA
jgi:hypothetical protein